MSGFAHLYDEFTATADRIEIRQEFAVPGDEPSLVAFRNGAPRPERSLRGDPWLRRMAAGVLAGKQWRRIRAVEFPLSEYVRWELRAYVESQACGEQIMMIDRAELGYEGPEPWLFDVGTGDGAVGELHYNDDGTVGDRILVTDPRAVARYRDMWEHAIARAVPLNDWLAEHDRG